MGFKAIVFEKDIIMRAKCVFTCYTIHQSIIIRMVSIDDDRKTIEK